MRLADLIDGTGATLASGRGDVDVSALTSDSRAVTAGALFAAMPGTAVDGATFAGQAAAAGAVAVLAGARSTVEVPTGVAVVRAEEPRLALAKIAARFYPRQPQTIVAVTGTNGKTSIAEFTRQIWHHLGRKAASLGTIGVVKGDGAVYGSLTTPDPITLHRTLQALADEGITHLALEASSHGLDQYRLDGVRLAAGAFNNLGRDHLDYHPTVEVYLEAKLQLFERLLKPGQPAIVNLDGGQVSFDVRRICEFAGLSVLPVGQAGTFISYRAVPDGFEQDVQIQHRNEQFNARLNLIGTYQASNVIVATAFALVCGEDPERVFETLSLLKTVNGRLDVVGRHNGGLAVVDYAHKPEALEAALDALRPFASGKLICVFGCGGNRDKGKRPIMGEIAARKADVVIVTDDNPRNEEPAAIRAEVLDGAESVGGAAVVEFGDRALAIREGVQRLRPGDVLLVAGKGHEAGQISKGVTHAFSDHDEIRAAMREATA